MENEFSINKNAIRGGKCDNCEDTLTPGGKNYDANISLEKLRFSLIFKYFLNSLVYNESQATVISVKLGKCDNFEDTFTKCDKNEDTRVRLEKSCLILIFNIFSQFLSVV